MKRFLFTAVFIFAALGTKAHPGSGIAVDADGRIFFTAGPMIIMVDTNSRARVIVHDEKNEKFYQLHHIQRAPDGGLLTASDIGDAIWRFSHEGLQRRFYPPENDMRALAVGTGGDPFTLDRLGNIYAVNSKQDHFTQILKVTPAGEITVLAGGHWGVADGKGTNAMFEYLHGSSMVMGAEGDLFLTDNQARVRRIQPDGTVTTFAGGAKRGFADGPGKDARFDGASGLAFDSAGNLLLAEQSGRIRKITPAGMVTTLAGSAKAHRADGSLLQASFLEPTGIAIAPNGDVFVLEPDGPNVRKISGGLVTTIHTGLP